MLHGALDVVATRGSEPPDSLSMCVCVCGGVGGSDEELGALPRDAKRRFECRASGASRAWCAGQLTFLFSRLFFFSFYLVELELHQSICLLCL